MVLVRFFSFNRAASCSSARLRSEGTTRTNMGRWWKSRRMRICGHVINNANKYNDEPAKTSTNADAISPHIRHSDCATSSEFVHDLVMTVPHAAVSMNDFGRTICRVGLIDIPPKDLLRSSALPPAAYMLFTTIGARGEDAVRPWAKRERERRMIYALNKTTCRTHGRHHGTGARRSCR